MIPITTAHAYFSCHYDPLSKSPSNITPLLLLSMSHSLPFTGLRPTSLPQVCLPPAGLRPASLPKAFLPSTSLRRSTAILLEIHSTSKCIYKWCMKYVKMHAHLVYEMYNKKELFLLAYLIYIFFMDLLQLLVELQKLYATMH
jgi:hypothetical protein